MENNISQHASKDQPSVEAMLARAEILFEQGCHQESLDISLQITRIHPELPVPWFNAAYNCLKLRRWQDAIRYAQTSLAHGGTRVELWDTLAFAYGELGQPEQARHYGLQALETRDYYFNQEPCIPLTELPSMPPLPGVQTCQRNVISFSLFGGNSQYCETAILNTQEQPGIYPHWICRFYVDNSVPASVIERLQKGGAQVMHVDGAAARWPGPMWRLLALADPLVHRILFRDADSVISRREAAAVNQWLTSGKRFHMMRDHCSHVELILAGMWGVAAGSLPPLGKLMERFMSAPPASRIIADQYFLRRYVWPYARASLMQHDSVFGFMGAANFPPEFPPEKIRDKILFVGANEGGQVITAKTDLPDESKVIWKLFRSEKQNDGPTSEQLICAYPAVVRKGVVTIHIPVRYWLWIKQDMAYIRVVENNNMAA